MKLERLDTYEEKSKYDYELDSAIMDMPMSEAGTNLLSATHSQYTHKFNPKNEDEARRFSYITSNLKALNASGNIIAGATMDKQIQKII